MSTDPLIQKLENAFNEFRSLSSTYRQSKLHEIESICTEIRFAYGRDSYVSGKLIDFLESCRQMARKRQPKSYNESSTISFALGDISTMDSQIQRSFA